MRTLCFLMEKPEALVAVAVTVQQLALAADHVHVQVSGGAGLPLRLADVAARLDAGRLRGRRQGLLGGLAGLLLALWLAISQPQGLALSLTGFLGASLLLGGFGVWLGFMLARSADEAVSPEPDPDALLSGRLRVLIAVPSLQQARALREFLSKVHPELEFEAESASLEPVRISSVPFPPQ